MKKKILVTIAVLMMILGTALAPAITSKAKEADTVLTHVKMEATFKSN